MQYNIKVTISQEIEPLGTGACPACLPRPRPPARPHRPAIPAAGPLALARAALDDGSGDPFFVFNSDVTCEYPLADLLAYHKSHGKEGTILVTRVDEPSKYGVVVHDGTGRIQHFVEKPQTFVGNHINAGMYCFSPSILSRISLKPTSIEKEIFPVMADEGQLVAMVLPGYWMDIGQPRDYLTGMCMHLASMRKRDAGALAAGPHIVGDVLVHPSATIGAGCKLGPNVVVGPDCVIEAGARVVRSTLLQGVRVRAHGLVSSSIVGWRSTIGQWARVEGGAVLGEDVQIGDETAVNGAIILPHKSIKDSIMVPGTIIM